MRSWGAFCLWMCCGACSSSSSPPAPKPSSDELIDQAVAQGTISAETGLVYQVFAVFGDNRLPSQYLGSGTVAGTRTMREARQQFDTLSSESQATLTPFLLPPSSPGSWIELPSASASLLPVGALRSALTIEWTKYPAVGGAVKVWAQNRYPADDALAQTIANEVSTYLWSKLFGQLSTLAMTEPSGDGLIKSNNGDDGSLDIYLVHGIADNGVTTGYNPGCSTSTPQAAWIQIDAQRPARQVLPTVAHELLHASQITYFSPSTNCHDYYWWDEATGKWAEDFAYPDRDTEHDWAKKFLTNVEQPLNYDELRHAYGAYLFPFMRVHQANDPGFVKRVYDLAATHGSLQAIDTALAPDGFEKVWPEFAKLNWNQDPVTDYQKWDRLTEHPTTFYDEIKVVDRLDQKSLGTVVKHLATRYIHISLEAHEVRQITLDNEFATGMIAGGHVWLIPKIVNEWKPPEELPLQKKYCRDRSAEDIDELILVVSNSTWDDENSELPDGMIRLSTTFAGCQGFSGSGQLTTHSESGVGPIDTTYIFSPSFQFDENQSDASTDYFNLTALSWTFHSYYDGSGLNPPCRTEQTASGGLQGGPMGMADFGTFVSIKDLNQYIWSVGIVGSGSMVTQVSNCGSPTDETSTFPFSPAVPSISMPRDFQPDGSAMGTVSEANGNTTTWNFQRTK